MNQRPKRAKAYAPDPRAPGRSCDTPGCAEAGEYRAPKSRRNLNEYHWFCLEHVRAYNSTWDYYKGMTPAQMEAELRADSSWQRPSWPLGHLGAAAWDEDVLRDPLHILRAGRVNQAKQPHADADRPPPDLREPLATLGLSWPTTMDAVKTRYKELAKRHHPDANGGSRDAEERLKTINIAYAQVRSKLGGETRVSANG